jgi:hypothetical protein
VGFATAARRVLGLEAAPETGLEPGRRVAPVVELAARRLATASTYVLPSPLSTASLDPALAAAFGISTASDTVTRREAMGIPAVRRARQIIAGTIGTFEWQALRGDDVVLDGTTAALLAQPDPDCTPQFVYSWTVDDLIFHGISWWHVTDRDTRDYPAAVERVARERVLVQYEGDRYRAYLDGREIPDRDLIRFDGPDEGVLNLPGTALRTALMLDSAVRRFARLDVPLGYLTPREGARELSTEPGSAGLGTPEAPDDRSEVELLLDTWEDARQRRSTGYLNAATAYETVQLDARQIQLAEAKQEQTGDIARMFNLPPRYVAAPQASSMTYSTTEGDRRELYDLTLRQYVTAIAQRLSMGDVSPRGQRVAPDVLSWLHGDTLAVLQAGQIGIATGVLDAEEVRTRWLKLPAASTPPKPPPSVPPSPMP